MKKLLCLVLTLAMVLTSFCFCLSASAKGEYDNTYRPDGTKGHEDIVGKIIDPIIANRKDSDFAESINEIGYESIDKLSGNLTKENFNTFITANADDSMFGVDYDFLYSKDNGAYFWSFLYKDLEVELTDSVINSVIAKSGANATAADFRNEWKSINGTAEFTIHDIEIYAANKAGKRTTCCKKGDYDACAEVLNGYRYDYSQKAADLEIFNSIVESRVVVKNPYTNKDEVHYNYSYDLSKGKFSLMRANGNSQILNTICKTWNSDTLITSLEVANENAIKIANFIGNLIYPNFTQIPSNTKVFTDNKIDIEDFFDKVSVLSGLDKVLQDNWCNAYTFDVKSIMYALGVNIDDNTLLNVELEKGEYMGSRILTDMFRGFFRSPVNYVEGLIQTLSRSYSYTYQRAIESLFVLKYPSMLAKSRSGEYPELDRYTGNELSSVDGLINFIADCIYVAKVDAGDKNAKKFSFAPLPVNRIVNANDADEMHLYFLCYMDINRKYENNAAMIETFISNLISNLKEDYKVLEKESDKNSNKEEKPAKTAEEMVAETEKVLRAMFTGELTLIDILGFHTSSLTENTLNSFDFMSTIKNAIASLFQKFVDAMDSLMSLLFGWTGGILG